MKHSTQNQGTPSKAAAVMTMHARPKLWVLNEHGRPHAPRLTVAVDTTSRLIAGYRLE